MPALKVPAVRRSVRFVLILATALAAFGSHAADRSATSVVALVASKATIPPPVLLTLPPSGNANPVTLTGTATPNAEVRVFVNSDLLELAVAAADGTFSATVPLYDGANTVTATAVVGPDESVASNALTSSYTNMLPRSQQGSISVDTVWTPGGGPYTVTADLTVVAGKEFTLMPGVELRFASGKKLVVQGNLVLHGKAGSYVWLHGPTTSTSKSVWAGVRMSGMGYVDANFARIENATCGALYFAGGDGSVRNSTLQYNDCGVSLQTGSSPEFGPGNTFTVNNTHVKIVGDGNPANTPRPAFTGSKFLLIGTSRFFKCEGAFGSGPPEIIDARGNWWGGSTSNPAIFATTPGGIADRIDDYSDNSAFPSIDFGNFLAENGAPVFTGTSIPGQSVTTSRTISAGAYQLLGKLQVAAGATLTLEPGVTIAVAQTGQNVAEIEVRGMLIAHGTPTSGIAISSWSGASLTNQWPGIRVHSTGFVDLDYVTIEHANMAIRFAGGDGLIRHTTLAKSLIGAQIEANSSPTFAEGFLFTGNQRGAVIQGNSSEANNPAPTFNGGEFLSTGFSIETSAFGNGAAHVIDATGNKWNLSHSHEIAAKIYDNSDIATLPIVNFSGFVKPDGSSHQGGFLFGPITQNRIVESGSYELLGNLRIAAGVALTLQPGVEILVPGQTFFGIDVNGTLVAHGTAAAPVKFLRSSSATATQWAGIRVPNSGSIDFDYVSVEGAAVGISFDGGEGVARHTALRLNGFGTKVNANSSPVFEDGFAITENLNGVLVTGNLSAASDPRPTFRNGRIHGNSVSHFRTERFGNGAAVVLDATGNCWLQDDPQLIRNMISDRYDVATSERPLVDFLDFQKADCSGPKVTAFDFTFPRRDADALGGITARMEYVLNTESSVIQEVVRDSDGAVVMGSAPILLARGAHSFEWDGRDQDGNAVQEDTYRVRTRLIRSGIEAEPIDPPIPAVVPAGNGDVPERFNGYRNQEWALEYHNLSPLKWPSRFHMSVERLDGPNQGEVFHPIGVSVVDAGDTWIFWDGRDPTGHVVEGQVGIYSGPVTQARPHYLRATRTAPRITGSGAIPDIAVKSNPNVVTLSYEQPSSLTFQLDVDAYVVVKLLPPGIVDPASPQAMVLLPEQLLVAQESTGEPRLHTIPWPVHESSDVNRMRVSEEGAYTFTIEARSPLTQRTALHRGVLQVRW